MSEEHGLIPTKPGVQFVVVWVYSNRIWSDTYRIDKDGGLEIEIGLPGDDEIWKSTNIYREGWGNNDTVKIFLKGEGVHVKNLH